MPRNKDDGRGRLGGRQPGTPNKDKPLKTFLRQHSQNYFETNITVDEKFISDFITRLSNYRAAKEEILTDEEQGVIAERINSVVNLKAHTMPVFDIKENAEAEDVSEIFVRVNSGGVSLKQNDFILTLLSLYWDDGRR